MKRFLTGLQPTGCITLGNYIGAIKCIRILIQYDKNKSLFSLRLNEYVDENNYWNRDIMTGHLWVIDEYLHKNIFQL